MPATTKARIGATTEGTRTLPTRPSAKTASRPAEATAEPTTPPISACEELEGRPKYQVIRFQEIAPIRPVKSKARAVPTTMTRMRSELTSRVLDDYALDDLGGGLRRVDRLLEHGEHVL